MSKFIRLKTHLGIIFFSLVSAQNKETFSCDKEDEGYLPFTGKSSSSRKPENPEKDYQYTDSKNNLYSSFSVILPPSNHPTQRPFNNENAAIFSSSWKITSKTKPKGQKSTSAKKENASEKMRLDYILNPQEQIEK